jgi:alpha-tubulin suppressor-like RCC1 family protein
VREIAARMRLRTAAAHVLVAPREPGAVTLNVQPRSAIAGILLGMTGLQFGTRRSRNFRVSVVALGVGLSGACSFGVDLRGYFDGANGADGGVVADAQTNDAADAGGDAGGDAGSDAGSLRVEFTSISVGASHSCALRADGTVACWGRNDFGQLGNDDPTSVGSSVPVLVRDLKDAVEVTAGGRHTCARRRGGALVCWGRNAFGQLGNGSTTDSAIAAPVTDITNAKQVVATYDATCALLDDANSTAVCWGENSFGTLGTGTNVNASVPAPVKALSGIKRLATSAYHTMCALKGTGAVSCWGYGPYNNAGTAGTSSTPSTVLNLGAASAVSAGVYHTCALVAGESKCWGYNANGQLGNNGRAASSAPVRTATISDAAGLASGNYHNCALAAGKLQCWGDNTAGQLGKSGDADALVPSEVALAQVIQVAAGGYETCALVEGGTVHCWGSNLYGELARNTRTFSQLPVPVALNEPLQTLALGLYHSCATTATQTLCWGLNDARISLGTTTRILASSTPLASAGTGLKDVQIGAFHTCGIGGSGPQCWGYGGGGSLGNGGTAASPNPTAFAPGLANSATQIVTGGFHTCALVAGKVLCSGINSEGQLGRATAPAYDVSAAPVRRGGADLSGVTRLVSGVYHTCAFAGGELLCWGYNGSGQLGNGTFVNQFSAVSITLASTHGALKELALGYLHSCGVFADGRAQCWGDNATGQLGNRTATASTVPVDVATSGLVREVALGTRHTCALLVDGTVECWGYNALGQLGHKTATNSTSTPTQVPGIQTAVAIRAINQRTCALLANGSAVCWGDNTAGQLGDGTLTQSPVPLPITDL